MMNLDKMPKHIALTLDGNRRWAVKHGMLKKMGIWEGIKKTKEVILDWTSQFEKEYSGMPFKEMTIHALTLNNIQNRPKEEIDEITVAFNRAFTEGDSLSKLNSANVRVIFGGRLSALDQTLFNNIYKIQQETIKNDKYRLNIAIAYDGIDEIKRAHNMALQTLTGELEDYLDFPDTLPIDFWIRTGGEMRLSGFMLWYMPYAELYFSDKLAEDFKYEDFIEALEEYQHRDRRFGK